MNSAAGSGLARFGKSLGCLLLQVMLLLALSPATASLLAPAYRQSDHAMASLMQQIPARHAVPGHDCRGPDPDADIGHGRCAHDIGCCMTGACGVGTLQAAFTVSLPSRLAFGTVRFTPEAAWWPTGRSAAPDLPPPRGIA